MSGRQVSLGHSAAAHGRRCPCGGIATCHVRRGGACWHACQDCANRVRQAFGTTPEMIEDENVRGMALMDLINRSGRLGQLATTASFGRESERGYRFVLVLPDWSEHMVFVRDQAAARDTLDDPVAQAVRDALAVLTCRRCGGEADPATLMVGHLDGCAWAAR